MRSFIDFISNIDIFIIIPLILTFFELLQIQKSRTAEVLYNIYNDIHTTKNLENIEWLYTVDLSDYSALTSEDKRRIDDVIDIFTRISFLCVKRLIPQKYFVEMYSGLIVHVWQHVKPYIYEKRLATGVTNYACYYEKIYKKAIKFRMKHSYDITIR